MTSCVGVTSCRPAAEPWSSPSRPPSLQASTPSEDLCSSANPSDSWRPAGGCRPDQRTSPDDLAMPTRLHLSNSWYVLLHTEGLVWLIEAVVYYAARCRPRGYNCSLMRAMDKCVAVSATSGRESDLHMKRYNKYRTWDFTFTKTWSFYLRHTRLQEHAQLVTRNAFYRIFV